MSDSLSISTSTNQVTGTGYSYDANGNMLGDAVNTMTYDGENRMVTSSNGSSSGAYVYDGNGVRVKKCVPNCSSATTTTRYIFSGSKVIAEYDNGAAAISPSREYLYAGGLKVATLVSTTPTYHLRDHLSVRVNTDSSGSIVGEQGHYPFGDSWYLNSTTTKEQFTTYERDAESGNDYAMARYNVNRLGRFSSIDPLSGNIAYPQSLNRYAYVTNDPINSTDPTGRAGGDAYEVSDDKCGDSVFTSGSVCAGNGDPISGEGGADSWGFARWMSLYGWTQFPGWPGGDGANRAGGPGGPHSYLVYNPGPILAANECEIGWCVDVTTEYVYDARFFFAYLQAYNNLSSGNLIHSNQGNQDNQGGGSWEKIPLAKRMGVLSQAGKISAPVATPQFVPEYYAASIGGVFAAMSGMAELDALETIAATFQEDVATGMDIASSICGDCSPFPPENVLQFVVSIITDMVSHPPDLGNNNRVLRKR